MMFDQRAYARGIIEAQKRSEENERRRILSMITGDSYNVCYRHIPTWSKKYLIECLACKKEMRLT